MRVIVCAMAKNEHLYINEWVKHYFKLGVDKIYLFDNDDTEAKYIGDYIDKEYLPRVKIIDIRGIHEDRLQHKIYSKFYQEHKKDFDWCCYFDIDEYLSGVRNIKEWLASFRLAKQVRIMWRLFGDDDLISRDTTKPLYGAFVKPINETYTRDLTDKGNLERQGKFIVRGNLDNVVIESPHFASFKRRDNVIPSILPSGRQCYSKVVIREDYSHETVYLNHYMTKSLEEYINQKLNRTDAVFGDISLKMDYYWRINKKTQEKLDYLKERGITCE